MGERLERNPVCLRLRARGEATGLHYRTVGTMFFFNEMD
jgi:hypothetical protein